MIPEHFLNDSAIETLMATTGYLDVVDRRSLILALDPFARRGSAINRDPLVHRILREVARPDASPLLDRVRGIFNLKCPGAFEQIEFALEILNPWLPTHLREFAAICAAVLVRPTEAQNLVPIPGTNILFSPNERLEA